MAVERAAKRRRLAASGVDGPNLPGFAKWNIEEDYERRQRKNGKKSESNRLPVKSQESGRWEQDATKDENPHEANEHLSESDDAIENDSGVADLQQELPPPKPKVLSKADIRQAKEDLAKMAGQISEAPDDNIGMLGSLAQFAESSNSLVQRLALATQLAVFKNIVPGYRIRPLSKDDAQAKVSKDVKKLRNFEQTLLRAYQTFVQSLARLARERARSESTDNIASVAISCACTLLTDLPHFNYRNDIIAILVGQLSNRQVDSNLVRCREALEHLFRDEEEGHASLEAVGQITKMIKTKNYNVHESVLNTFLHLRLLGEFAHKASTNKVDKGEETEGRQMKQKKVFRSKRERKALRERKEVEKEMKEADATVSYEERDKNQAETLKLIFVAYFRILKARTGHLMGAVLEGLAKYAHLINQDFFGDVLEALKDLINESSVMNEREGAEEDGDDRDLGQIRDATRESLLCIVTAFALLQGQQEVVKSASSLNLDLSFFTTHLYRTLLPLAMDSDIELGTKSVALAEVDDADATKTKTNRVNVSTTAVLLLRSLQAVLLPPTSTKMVPPLRVAAFTKQLQTVALHLPQKSSAAVLELLQQVTKVHGGKIRSLWDTEERKGDGVFDALSGEYSSSNPFASTIWEGEMWRLHFDPKVRDAVRAVERNIAEVR